MVSMDPTSIFTNPLYKDLWGILKWSGNDCAFPIRLIQHGHATKNTIVVVQYPFPRKLTHMDS